MDTVEKKQSFIELRAKGYSYREIAKQIDITPKTLVSWNRDLKEEVEARRALELEALYENYYLLKEHKVKLFGDQLKKIREELDSRDFSDVPTDKLLDLLLKYSKTLEEEFTPLKFADEREVQEQRSERRLLEDLTGVTPTRSTLHK